MFRETVEIVDGYKYLGYWFSTSGTNRKHVKKMARKIHKAANTAWEV